MKERRLNPYDHRWLHAEEALHQLHARLGDWDHAAGALERAVRNLPVLWRSLDNPRLEARQAKRGLRWVLRPFVIKNKLAGLYVSPPPGALTFNIRLRPDKAEPPRTFVVNAQRVVI